MIEKKRLVKLLNAKISHLVLTDTDFVWTCERINDLADHLLDNGVLVPPCKVGDKVYSITECSCENIDGVHTECEFYGYGEDDRICTVPNGSKCPYQYRIKECCVMEMNILMFTRVWGKTVFLTREEAEKALAERGEKENDNDI